MEETVVSHDHLWELTPREREVAALAAEGLSNPEIARRLGIGEQTARTHVSNVLSKLGVSSRREVAERLDGKADAT